MSKIRLNTELRNKFFNRIKNHIENEDTQEKEAYLQARENVDKKYVEAFEIAKGIVERTYPTEDVEVLKQFKKSMAVLVMWLQKINAFILHTARELMMREKKLKLNLILILDYMEI
jgi:hypothetical protein